jgi:hypothetical protein
LAGPAGTILAEFLTEFVPDERLRRLEDFAARLAERVSGMEDTFTVRLRESAAYGALAEDVSVAAVRSASAERRRDLAELLCRGLLRSDAELIEQHALLHLLEELNDAQVVILMEKGSFSDRMHDPARDAFIERHATVFAHSPTAAADEQGIRRWTVYRHYEDALVAMNLLKDREGVFTPSGGYRHTEITALGRLLLVAIGRGPSDLQVAG